MKLLEEIPTFPASARTTLETDYGIETAEAFYAHGVNDPEGLRAALHSGPEEFDRLLHMVEGYLPADYVERCRQPQAKYPRGLRID
jgi:hypothetical protein